MPSARTIKDICEKFSISEKWLLTGEGEMKSEITREAEIAEITSKLFNSEEQPWLVPIVKALCDLDVSDWEKILDVAEQVIAARKEKAGE